MDPEAMARIEASRERMRRLIEGMSDDDLASPLVDGSGWTVAATFAHIAFWDRRALLQLQRWEREGYGPPPADLDATNGAALPQWLALPPRIAAEQALAAAEEIDQAVATLTAEQVAAIAALDTPIRLNRSTHRDSHCDEIERRREA